MGLVIDKGKTKYTVTANTQKCSKTHTIEMGRYNFERVDSFTYLGSLVTGNNNVSEEMTNCLIAANRLYFGQRSQLKSQLLSRKTKIPIFKTIVRPVFTYATETLTMTKNDERRQRVSSKGYSFTEYMVQYARDGSGKRDTIEK